MAVSPVTLDTTDQAPGSRRHRARSVPRARSFTDLTLAEVASAERADLERGLSSEEARARLERTGPNEIGEQQRVSAFERLARQFKDVTVLALLGAGLLAALIGLFEAAERPLLERFGDSLAIAVIVVLNATIGFFQERKAEKALSALRELGAPETEVVRDGVAAKIPASAIVPGDLVVLGEGSRVPADLRLAEVSDLLVSEAALTGESHPVDKDTTEALPAATPLAERTNMLFMGTHVVRGTCRGLVVATGMSTELGRIALLLGRVESPETPLQASLKRFGKLVVAGCLMVGALVLGVGLWRMEASWAFLVLTAVSLAVAAIPEGLPAITTIVLALGVQRMAKKNALIRRLAAVETLGSADVICTDKTGTLTQNRMAVRRIHAGGQTLDADALPEHGELSPAVRALLGACRYAPFAERGDPTDAALYALHAASAAGTSQPSDPIRTLPFDGERKMATQIVTVGEVTSAFTHGAAERVLAASAALLGADGEEIALDEARRAEIARIVNDWAAQGLRVLALARSKPSSLSPAQACTAPRGELLDTFERGLVLIGAVGLADPPRVEVKQAIARARSAGVSTVMITGDHPLTAAAIGAEIGLSGRGDEVVLGAELDQLSKAELEERSGAIRLVARATAESKLRLVEALRARGHVVAMTGDGVNDAPAIKAASIGIAMGQTGTDVAREAADMVLFDDNYATIVAAIEEGRLIYGNIKRFILFLFSVNAGLVAAVFVGAVLGWPAILTPTQILWINLITNGLPALALGMEPAHDDPMRSPPRDPAAPLLSRSELWWLLAYGALMGVLGLTTFTAYAASAGGPLEGELLERARTATFTVLAIAPLFHAQNCRARERSLLALGVLSNWRLIGAFFAALVLQAIAVYVPVVQRVFGTAPLEPHELLTALAVSASVLLVGEGEKAVRRALKPQPTRP